MSIVRHTGLAASLAVAFLIVAAPSGAQAQGPDKGPTKAERLTARDAYDKGKVAFDKGDYVTAVDSFVKANALIPSAAALFWIAQAQDKLGRTEVAIEAYEAITARADFASLSEDKAALVHERLAALKPAPAPAPAPSPAPPGLGVDGEFSVNSIASPLAGAPPTPPAPPAPVVATEPPPALEPTEPLPQKNTAELGVTAGILIVSDDHNLVERSHTQRAFDAPVWQIGLRAAFFPLKVLGGEAEWTHGFGTTVDKPGSSGGSANFDAVRAHVIGQLPNSRFVPFALLGVGMLHGSSKRNGTDTDFALHAGVGLKFMATKLLVPRLDLRLNMSQAKGGGFGDGVAVDPEILLGLSFTLGR